MKHEDVGVYNVRRLPFSRLLEIEILAQRSGVTATNPSQTSSYADLSEDSDQSVSDASGNRFAVGCGKKLGPKLRQQGGSTDGYKHLVYHAILEEMSFGTALYMLYATAHEEDVEGHRAGIEQLCPMVFAANLDDPDCSEFGFTPIRVSDGGLRYDR